jgi:beta-lactamase class D
MSPFPAKTFRLALQLTAFLAILAPASLASSAPEIIECTVILDQETGAALVRSGACGERFTPMSTFKVPLALMGYDAGVLKDEHSPQWEYDPKFDAPKRARKPVDPTIWEEESILWYSQELTRKLGAARFARYIETFGYGNGDISGMAGQDNGLTHSWLSSSLLISADEQAHLMRRILARDLPVSDKALAMTSVIIPTFEAKDGWRVQGKTGSGSLRGRNGKLDRTRPIGWFVGWAEKDGRKIAFARLRIGNQRPTEPSGLALRAIFLKELPPLMHGK